MARRVRRVRTHGDTSAKTGMLYAAQRRTQPQRTWCQRGYSMLHDDRAQPPNVHIPPSFLCLTGPKERERRAGKEKDRDTHQSGGREKVQAREKGRGKGKEQRSHERKGGEPAAEQGTHAGKGGTTGTRRAQHRTEALERGAPEGEEKSGTAHHDTHRTDTTHTAHTHICAHSTWPASPGSPPRGRAAGGGTAPDPRRPSTRRTATAPGTPYRHPHGAQRQPARARAVGPVLGPHARTDRTRETRVAEPWLPAPEDGRPGEGQRLTPDAPHNVGRPPPPGDGAPPPPRTKPPQGIQAKGTVFGPHTHTPAPTAGGWRTPTARPVGGQSGEGQRLTSNAPHNGGRHPPWGRPSSTPTASNPGPQGRTLWGPCWVPTSAPTAPGTHGSRNPGCLLKRTGGRGRDSA